MKSSTTCTVKWSPGYQHIDTVQRQWWKSVSIIELPEIVYSFRYEAERLSMGLRPTQPLLPQDWVRPIPSGYDPQMPGFSPRSLIGSFHIKTLLMLPKLFTVIRRTPKVSRGDYGR